MRCQFALCFAVSSLMANPSGLQVIVGEASTATPSMGVLQVTASDGAILYWDDFSIADGETTEFILPDGASSVLNRVAMPSASDISGQFSANGSVYFINQSGISVASTGVVNTADFIATTLDAPDADFFTGDAILLQGSSTAACENHGSITTTSGDLFLVSYAIDNQGTLTADQGLAALGAGSSITILPSGSPRLQVTPAFPGSQSGIGILDAGTVHAQWVEMQADGTIYTEAVRHTGVAQATQVSNLGGSIVLLTPQGLYEEDGQMTCSTAFLFGNVVHLMEHTDINVASQGVIEIMSGLQRDPGYTVQGNVIYIAAP